MTDSNENNLIETNFQQHVELLPRAFGGSLSTGILKQSVQDFIVNEQLSFEPSGEGEHAYLYIQKNDLNTEDVAKCLAKHAGVTRKSVSFAGMKDKRAVTQQWFSVHLPGVSDPDWSLLNNDQIEIKKITRHLRKLKRGAIKFNSFEIIIQQLSADHQLIQQRVADISQQGVPNYFMAQRFGYKANNLSLAERIFYKNHKIKDRNKKGILLSAVRSYLFNEVLAERVSKQSWNKAIEGDTFVLDGTRNFFANETIDEEIIERIKSMDIHPSGCLFGTGKPEVLGKALAIEQAVLDNNQIFCDGLLKEKVAASRRPLRMKVSNFTVSFIDDSTACFSFDLPSGSYATAVMRELFETDQT